MTRIILDTGPLVSYLRKSDHRHDWAKEQFKRFPSPFWTCEPVLTEAAFLLGRFGGNQNMDCMLELVSRNALRVDFSLASESVRILGLTRQYRDVPMSLADACLVRMSELQPQSLVLTLDSDFNIYRRHGREPIPLITDSAP